MSKILFTEPAHIIVDPVTEAAMAIKSEKNRKNEKLRIEKQYMDLLKKWMKDDSRVRRFKDLGYKLMNDSYMCVEIAAIYFKDSADTPLPFSVEESFLNISVTEESTLQLFAYAKDLATGNIYTISDSFTISRPNQRYAEWVQISSEKPTYREEVPAPPRKVSMLDSDWDKHRFFLDKVKLVESPADFYTFIIHTSHLQTLYKKVTTPVGNSLESSKYKLPTSSNTTLTY